MHGCSADPTNLRQDPLGCLAYNNGNHLKRYQVRSEVLPSAGITVPCMQHLVIDRLKSSHVSGARVSLSDQAAAQLHKVGVFSDQLGLHHATLDPLQDLLVVRARPGPSPL